MTEHPTPEAPHGAGPEAGHHGPPSVDPNTTRWIIRVLIGVCIAVSLADFAYSKHGHYGFEQIPAFHSLYGFVACVFLVIAATALRRFIMRGEAYYD